MGVIISKKSVDAIIGYEVSSEAIYNKKYVHPILPGENSGITIGIGYDLGMSSIAKIEKDWTGYISNNDLELIKKAAGKIKSNAAVLLPQLLSVTVSFHDAVEVFINDLKSYAQRTLHLYPGLDLLFYDAQGAIISLTYNRGASFDNSDRRKEMKALVQFIADKDYKNIAAQFRSMKRLWDPKVSKGLIIRRENEAVLVETSDRIYSEEEKINLS